MGAGSPTLECMNLRTDEEGTMRPVGHPAKVAPKGHRPLLSFSTPEGEMLLTAAEGKLYVFGTEEQPAEVDSTDAEALCAFYIAGRLHVMTAAGLRSYAYPGFAPLGTTDASRYPAVTLSAAPGPMPLRAEVGRRTLSGDYRREAALNTADSRAVESDIRAAYTALASEARAQGVMMQPALARYTLHDAAGNILFTSPAVLLGSAQCLRTQSLDCDSEGNLEGYTLTADTWRPRIAVPQYFCPGVHSVRVWLTPQLQPVDTSAQPSVWLRHGTTASATVSVRLGRSELAIDPANPATSGRVVFEAVARMDMTERCVAEMRATAGLETETDCGPEAMPAAELSAMRAAMCRRPEVADYTECSLRAPHGFSAECVAVSGDTVMWGNVRPRRYAGYPLPLFAASTSADAWSGFVAVDFADGSRAVWKGGGETGAPVRLNPLLSYPAADATALTIGFTTSGGGRFLHRVALTPVQGMNAASYLHPELAAFAPDETEQAPEAPPEADNGQALPDHIVAADTATPHVALASRGGFGTSLQRLVAAPGSTASWDFGRTRVYAFGIGGIYTAALSSSRDRLAAGRLDTRGTERAGAVAPATDGHVYAVAGRDLVRVGAHSCRTVVASCGYDTLVWCGPHSELWCMRDGIPGADMLRPHRWPMRVCQRELDTVSEVLGDGTSAYAATESGLLALHREEPGMTTVAWRCYAAPFGGARQRLRCLTLHASGSNLRLDVAAYASGMAEAENTPTIKSELRGNLRQALPMSFLMRPVRHTVIEVGGRVGSDFTFRRIELS